MLGNVMPHYSKLQRLITKKVFKVLIYLVAIDKICHKGATLKKVLGKVSVRE